MTGGNSKLKVQLNLMEHNATRVWVTLVFVLLNSTTLDPIDTHQPKDLEKCWKPMMDDLQVSEWCNHQANLWVDSQGSLWDNSLRQHWDCTNTVIWDVLWI